MLNREDETDTEVRLVDQKKINEFGRLNTQKGEYQLDLVIANKALSQLEAAEEEIMLSDADGDDAAKFLLGDCFMSVNEEYVNDKLEELKDEKQVEIDGLEKRIQEIGDRQKELKAQLYERFGTSINLDA